MSYMRRSGEQMDPDELTSAPSSGDFLKVARAIAHDDRLPEDERQRLVWVVMDALDYGAEAEA